MYTTRREFLALAASVGATSLFPRLAPARPLLFGADTYFEWKKLGDGLFAGLGDGGNSLVVLGDKGSVLVDTKNAGLGATLRREVEGLGSPLALVINTHHHQDHSGGNNAFTKDIPVLAHSKAKARMGTPAQMQQYIGGTRGSITKLRASPHPAAKAALADAEGMLKSEPKSPMFEPTKTTEGNETITAAGLKIELVHVGAGHTDNDLIVYFPEKNLLHTGDVCFNKVHPYFDVGAGANSAGWARSCEKVLSMCNDKTVIIPGHGDLGDSAAVKAQIEYFKAVRGAADKAVAAGKTRDVFIASEVEPFVYGERIKSVAFGAIYDEAVKGTPGPK